MLKPYGVAKFVRNDVAQDVRQRERRSLPVLDGDEYPTSAISRVRDKSCVRQDDEEIAGKTLQALRYAGQRAAVQDLVADRLYVAVGHWAGDNINIPQSKRCS